MARRRDWADTSGPVGFGLSTNGYQPRMDEQDRMEIRDRFREATNMAPAELEQWLETEESKSVGDADEGESTGHASGRRIVDIKRRTVDELDDSDHEHMQKVVGYIRRHLAQRPAGDVEDTPWRYSLMNWGHDPVKS